MVQPVFQYGVTLANQCLCQSEVCHVAGGEQQCAWIAGEFSELVFKRMVCTRMAIDQMRSTAAGTVLFDTFDERRFNFGVIGKTQVVIAAKTDDLFAIDDHLGLLGPITDTAFAIKVVIFSLLQFFM